MSIADDNLYDRIRSDRGSRPERPVEALELSMRYLDWMRTSDYQENVSRYTRTLAGGMALNRPDWLPAEDDVASMPNVMGDILVTPAISLAMNGMTQYVSPQMMDLLVDLASTMPTDALFPTDVMFPDGGLIVFPFPLMIPPGDGRYPDIPVSAVGVSPSPIAIMTDDGVSGDGVVLTIFSRSVDIAEWMRKKSDPDFRILPSSPLANAPLVIDDVVAWAYGVQWGEASDGEEPSSLKVTSKVSYVRRFLLAYFRLLWQEILDAEIVPLPRPVRRRLDRLSPAGRETGDVLRVVRLRKVYEEFDAPEDRLGSGSPFQHGFMRRGHWRRIHQGTDKERVVYVRAHLVRPDLPQIDSWAVASVER